jgi:hypothetical protein
VCLLEHQRTAGVSEASKAASAAAHWCFTAVMFC